MRHDTRLADPLPDPLGGWPGACVSDWSKAAADTLEAALRVSDATGRYVCGLTGLWARSLPRTALVVGPRDDISAAIRARLAGQGLRVLSGDTPGVGAEPGAAAEAGSGDRCERIAFNPADSGDCRDAAGRIARRHGPVDVLVHVLESRVCNAEEVPAQLAGVYNLSKCFIDGMSERAYGRIVIVCLAPKAGRPGATTECGTQKAGVLAFSRSLAREVAARGITVNVVSPGFIGAPQEAPADGAHRALIERIPARRLAAAAEVAHVVAFLADADTGYVTGADIPVSGGLRF